MRIAILTNDFPSDDQLAQGLSWGAGRIAAIQVRLLKEAGHEVRIWHVPFSWGSKPGWDRFIAHIRDRKPRMDLVQEIVAWQPTTLITHNLTGCGFGTPRKVQEHGVRWIHILHDVQLFEPSGQMVSAMNVTVWQLFWSWLRRHALGKPNMVLSPTGWLLRKHRRREFFLSDQISCEILPNPADFPRLSERRIHHPMRLLYVGRIAVDKGSTFLARLIERCSFPCEWHVVGEGPGVADLRRLGESVQFHGRLSEEEVKQMMDTSDVLLVPSLIEENQPTVILEASSTGLPVIASDKGGIPETMGRSGIICPPQHLDSWLRAIQDLQQEVTYKHISESMYAVARLHDPENYRQRFLSLVTSNR